MAPYGPITIQLAGIEIEAIIFFKHGTFVFNTEFNLSFHYVNKFFPFVAKKDHFSFFFQIECDNEGLHMLFGLLKGQGFTGISQIKFFSYLS